MNFYFPEREYRGLLWSPRLSNHPGLLRGSEDTPRGSAQPPQVTCAKLVERRRTRGATFGSNLATLAKNGLQLYLRRKVRRGCEKLG